jgi:hypothetical protein
MCDHKDSEAAEECGGGRYKGVEILAFKAGKM